MCSDYTVSGIIWSDVASCETQSLFLSLNNYKLLLAVPNPPKPFVAPEHLIFSEVSNLEKFVNSYN